MQIKLLLRFLFLLSIALWVGGMFFFSSIAAPSIFKTLDRTLAGDVVSAIFRKYYLLGYICGAIAILTYALAWAFETAPNHLVYTITILCLVAMVGLFVYSGEFVRPEAHRVRTELRSLEPGSPKVEAASKRFSSLHRRSVAINGAVFALGIVIILLTAYNYRE
ncbi:MAG: DUF4149 domain-containing protein [Candidatus Caldarchaeum sp.]